jgi:trehalose 6-phosphate synthase/phosphatase
LPDGFEGRRAIGCGQEELMKDGRLIIASNRLPFTIRPTGSGVDLQPTSGGLAAALAAVHQRDGNVWVGWPGEYSGLDAGQQQALERRLSDGRIEGIHLSHDEVLEYYDGVCNSVLWPVFHYLIDRVPIALPDFQKYRAVNERFAARIEAVYRPGDVIWIHDYHLMLAPAMVRARIPEARIAFFLHIPFPAGDVFRVLPWRRELLDGLLGASQLGFQTARDARNFADSLALLTEYRSEAGAVVADGREIRFGAYPIGIDAARLDSKRAGRDAGEPIAVRTASGRKLLVGVDRLDYTKGIPRRLAAFERLLEENHDLRGHVELLQVAVPSRATVASYVSYKQEVDALVARVNDRFGTDGWTPIRYLCRSVSPADLKRIYQAADVMLVTSLRDGMNLVAKEFVCSRTDDDGVLILSEMAGAAEELSEAVLVNPYSIEHLAAAIGMALHMDRGERRLRMRALRQRVSGRGVEEWLSSFLSDLQRTTGRTSVPAPDVTASILASVAHGREAALVLEYESALVPGLRHDVPSAPDPELLDVLRALSQRAGVSLHVLSSLDHDTLDAWFADTPVVLWGNHGLWTRERDGRRWRRTQWTSMAWKDDVRLLFEQFTSRTPGSFVEERPSALIWHFGRAEPVLARTNAQLLGALLDDAAVPLDYRVSMPADAVHVRCAGAHAATALEKLIESSAPATQVFLFSGSCGETDLRRVLRPGDRVVGVGEPAMTADCLLPDLRAVRSVLRELSATLPEGPGRVPVFRKPLRPAVSHAAPAFGALPRPRAVPRGITTAR